MSTVYDLELTFTEPLLGTAPLNPDLYADYIATKAPEPVPDEGESIEEAVETAEEMLVKGTTGFHRLDGNPCLYDYHLRGFFKDACSMLSRVEGTRSNKLKAYKKVIDGLLFVTPRQIPLVLSGPVTILERPLRAQTAQGERVALSRSEMAPTGTKLSCVITVLGVVEEPLLREWLDYATLRGLGQWRNASYGRASYTLKRGEG